jgi:predicted phage terminase large subunit-like protein
LPAIAEDEDDPLGRARGEALWPSEPGFLNFPVEEIEKRADLGTRTFSALYQGRPAPAGGLLFKREDFQHRYRVAPQWLSPEDEMTLGYSGARPQARAVVVGVDTSAGKSHTVDGDYSVFVTMAFADGKYFVLGCERKRVQFRGLVELANQVQARFHPRMFFIEDSSNGTALIQELRANSRINLVPVTPKGDKESRCESLLAPRFEAGRILLPERADWLGVYIEEFCSFGGGQRHDDMVDATYWAVHGLRQILARQQDAAMMRAAANRMQR